jgi:hypothetical protein
MGSRMMDLEIVFRFQALHRLLVLMDNRTMDLEIVYLFLQQMKDREVEVVVDLRCQVSLGFLRILQ